MHSLLTRKQVKLSSAQIRRKRRRRSSDGGQDTLEEDDGLATGVITLKAVPLNSNRAQSPAAGGSSTSHPQQQQQGRLGIRFCWAHSARHFALSFAGRSGASSDTVYDGEAWVSVLGEQTKGESDREGHKEAGLKIGEVVREIAYTQPTDTDSHSANHMESLNAEQ